MAASRYSIRALFVGRGRMEIVAWIVSLVFAVGGLAAAARTGKGWGSAIAFAVLVVLYTFVPWLRAWNIERAEAREGTLTVDDWGVTRVVGDLREAVAWDELAWVRIYTTSAGPGGEDVFFALGGADGKGCLVGHRLAVKANLVQALQARLPDFDNRQAILAMGSTEKAHFTVWTRPPAPPDPPPGLPN